MASSSIMDHGGARCLALRSLGRVQFLDNRPECWCQGGHAEDSAARNLAFTKRKRHNPCLSSCHPADVAPGPTTMPARVATAHNDTYGRRFQVRELATLDRSPTVRRGAGALLV